MLYRSGFYDGSVAAFQAGLHNTQRLPAITVSGDRRDADRFLGLFDASSPNEINRLLPPGAPLQP